MRKIIDFFIGNYLLEIKKPLIFAVPFERKGKQKQRSLK